jgi:hypothetical protein
MRKKANKIDELDNLEEKNIEPSFEPEPTAEMQELSQEVTIEEPIVEATEPVAEKPKKAKKEEKEPESLNKKQMDDTLKQWQIMQNITQNMTNHFEKIFDRFERISLLEQKSHETQNKFQMRRMNPFIFGLCFISILLSVISMTLAQSARQAALMPNGSAVIAYTEKQEAKPVQNTHKKAKLKTIKK